ncbi:anti-sigma regulatory factor (Ser/Thr protein kinase) [Allocatelliglobosispora scoriae]|uniref:Anti-sigma regulatory factor (Ser/Thr protein kinase) n=1 Tax=Allocatelliglobosispora scoriae TaxID=643052 RepID=A0A841BIM3_9ACTN|nr:sensor histidine kinase [Allocatelliglobosispora scoriae]MBB5866751.1 anti-sigma regulatory factor (Ser/Thr protein kinase) [Allocatelliglobosispora scoriae]
MRSGAAAGHAGILHETAFYASDEEFLAVVLPFLREGVEAGEPTVSLFGERNQQLIRSALGPGSGVTLIDGGPHYLRPAVAIKRHRQMLAGYVEQGAAQIRIAGDVPHPGTGVPWEWWARYEAAANDVYDEFPMYGLCPYDTRTAPAQVLDHVLRTHTHVVTADGGREPSPVYQKPREFLASAAVPWLDPAETGPPAVRLLDPAPAQAREAIETLQPLAGLARDDLNGLLVSASEAVSNAVVHGRAPVVFEAWAATGRIIVTVNDGGRGPADPLAGLMPGTMPGGLGLWLAHQMCAYVSMRVTAAGFTIRLVSGDVILPASSA